MRELSAREERALRFARAELRRVLGALSLGGLAKHVHLELVGRARTGPASELSSDGFAIVPAGGEYRIVAKSVRGLVYGAYGLLESLGCRWYFPGPEGEYLPARPAAPPREDVVENPDTPQRALVAFWYTKEGPGPYLKDYAQFAMRSRYNRFYLHWPTGLREAVRTAKESAHGLGIGTKLHIVRDLLPPTLFAAHPEWFRFAEGKRTPDYNLCVSNPAALAEATRNAVAQAKSIPLDITDFAYWQDDVPDAWCHCPKCAGLSSSEQCLRLMTAIAKGLRQWNHRAHLSFLSYYATAAPPQSERISSALYLEYAPHSSCYHHDIDDPACPRNAPLMAYLAENLVRFDKTAPHLFEYWLDDALFSFYKLPLRRMPLLLERMSHDVRYYRWQGLAEIASVQQMPPPDVGHVPELANPGFAFLPRLLWNPHTEAAAFLRRFAQHYYGAAQAAAVLDLVQQADRANPRYACEATDRKRGARGAARLLARAMERIDELARAAAPPHRERLGALGTMLRHDLACAEAGKP
jgi:hypothetical protein